ncbi:MAG TPA: hypothetical protein VMF30_16930 [Pirellulales bacterium]|nr:hypothetical protein [Pirellulales bacterium]
MKLSDVFTAPVALPVIGADVTWAGPNPAADGLCIGFDDGTIRFFEASNNYLSQPQKISPSGEAINSAAAVAKLDFAFSTRSDVTFIRAAIPGQTSRSVYRGGAHDVVATRSGSFVAALGMKGLLLVHPEGGDQQTMYVTDAQADDLYFYRLAALSDASGKEALVFANRRGGVGVSEFLGVAGQQHVHTMTFKGLDVVDVCAVAHDSLSAVAISSGAEILWIKDASRQEDPVAMKLQGVGGTIYRVQATPQHLFVLSSDGVYAWEQLIPRLTDGDGPVSTDAPLVLPAEAIDMSVYGNERLLLVMAKNTVMQADIRALFSRPRSEGSASFLAGHRYAPLPQIEFQRFAPVWHRSDIVRSTMVGAA